MGRQSLPSPVPGMVSWRSLFAVQLVVLPYTLSKLLWWCATWVARYHVMRLPYRPEDNELRTRWALGMSQVGAVSWCGH